MKLKVLNSNSKKMRAVLRVPRMAKQFHDMTRIENLPEFECIEDIYNKHYELTAEEILEKENSPDFRKLSIAEKSLIQRSLGTPPNFNMDSVDPFEHPSSIRGVHHQRLMTQAFVNRKKMAATTLEPLKMFKKRDGSIN